MISTILTVAQAVLAVLLIAIILLQKKSAGLGAAFGGDDYVVRTRRGAEKRLHEITVAFAILFFGIALAQILI